MPVESTADQGSGTPTWGLRYASHIRTDTQPLFLHSVGSHDPVAHVRFAHSLGLSGVQDPWVLTRPESEVAALAGELEATGLEGSCVVFAPIDVVKTPLWAQTGSEARERIAAHIERACAMAQRIDSRTVAIIATADSDRDLASQQAALIDNLKAAGDLAARHDITLAVETMRSLPNMLLRNYRELYDVLQKVNSKHVKVIFDTHHIAATDGPEHILPMFSEMFRNIGVVQIADYPKKVEPGADTLDLVPLLSAAMRSSLATLVEWEHGWSEPGAEGEMSGLARIRQFDAAAQAAARA